MAGIKFDITGDNKNFLNSLNGAQRGVTNAIGAIEKAGRGIESTFTRIKDSALGGFADIAKGMMGLTALLQAGNFFKTLIDDAGKFHVAMKEVSTLSDDVANHLQEYKDQVVDMTTQIPIGATEAAKALYSIESAGHHGADGLNILRESAKGAIGGVTETATTADAITTILNAYKKDASEAQHVSDLLFTTVRLGKTTMSELGHSISQVAPVAAAYGVSIEDVLAAIASLTKQGTPTSIAIRQVRDAITATTASLGDAAFQGRNFLDAMDDVAKKSQGSQNALKDDLSRLGAINAVLALTGKNAASARQDMMEMQESAGAAEAAYEKMASTAGTQTTLLRNNIFKNILPIANEIKTMSGEIAGYLNEAFDSGAMDTALTSLEAFIATYAVYKGMVATTAAWNSAALGGVYSAQIAELQTLIPLKELDGQADLQAAVAKGTLTKEQALLVASLRGEVEARYEEIMAAEVSARAELKAATAAEAAAQANVAAAEEIFVAAQARMEAATQSGAATEIEAAKEELNTAARLKNTAVTELNTATRHKNGAATMVSVTAKNADTAATLMNTTQEGANTVATGILATAKLQLKKAIDAVNSSFLASPLFWIAAVIAGVTYAVYKLVTAESAHDAAVRKTNEALEEQKKQLDERKSTIDGLIRTLQDPNATDYQKIKAYDQLKVMASDITDAYSKEALATMEAADAQKILNESMDEAEYEELVKKVRDAEKAYKDALAAKEAATTSSSYGYYDPGADYSGNQLIEAETSLKALRAALEKVEEMREEARKAAQEAATPIEVRIQEAKENEAEKQRIFDFYDDVMIHVDDIQESHNQLNFNEAQTKLDAYISEVEAELADLHTKAEQNPIDEKVRLEEEEKTNLLNNLLQWKRDMAAGGFTTIPLMFKADWGSAQAALNAATGFYQNLLTQTTAGGAQSMADVYNEAKRNYDTALAEWKRVSDPKNRASITPTEYNNAKSNLATTKSTFEAAGGDPDGKLAKAAEQARRQLESEREKTVKQGEQLFEQQLAERQRQAKQRQDMEDAIADAAIAGEQNRARRELMQAEKDHKDALAAIDRQAEEMRKANYEAAKKEWEASNTDKTKTWSDTATAKDVAANGYKNIALTKKQLATLKAEEDKANAERVNAEKEVEERLVSQYQSYTDRKIKIDRQYQDDVARINAAIAKAEERGDKQAVEALKRSLAEAAKERAKSQSELSLKQLKETPEYIRAFEDLDNTSTETLQTLISMFEKAKDAAAESMNPEDLREYTQTLQQLYDKVGERDPFAAMKVSAQAMRDAHKEVIAAENRLNAVRSGVSIPTSFKLNKETGEITATYLTEEEAVRLLAAAKDKEAKATNQHRAASQQAQKAINELAAAIQGVGNAMGGTAGQVLGMIGDVMTFATSCMQAITFESQATSAALRAVESASVILAVISAAIQLLQTISKLNKDAHAQYEEYAAKVSEVEQLRQAMYEYRMELIKTKQEENGWFSTTGFQELRDQWVQSSAAMAEYAETAAAAQAVYENESGGGWLTGALSWLGKAVGWIVSIPGQVVSGLLDKLGIVDKKSFLGKAIEWTTDIGFGGAEAFIGKLTGELLNAQNYAEGTVAAIKNLRVETRAASSGFLGTGIGGHSQKTQDLQSFVKEKMGVDLFDANGVLTSVELGKRVMEEYGDKMVGETKKTMERLIELKEQYDEWQDQLREFISELYSPIADDMVDALWEWYENGTNIMDAFKSYSADTFRSIGKEMVKQLVNTLLFDELKEKMQALLIGYSLDAADVKKRKSEEQLTQELMAGTQLQIQNLLNKAKLVAPVLQNAVQTWEEGMESMGLSTEESFENVFSSIKDNFKSMLLDMESDATDFGKQLKKAMYEALLERFVMKAPVTVTIDGEQQTFDSLNSYLDNWQKRANEVAQTMSATEHDTQKSSLEEQIAALEAERKANLEARQQAWNRDGLQSQFDSLYKQYGYLLRGGTAKTEEEIKAKERLLAMQEELAKRSAEYDERNTEILAKIRDLRSQLAEIEASETLTDEERAAKIAELNAELEEQLAISKQIAKTYADMAGWTMEMKIDASPLASLGDELLSVLQDTSKGVDDWKKELVEAMTNDLIKEVVYNADFEKSIRDLQEQYVNIMSSDMSAEEKAAAIQKIADAIAALYTTTEEKVDGLKNILPDIDTSPFDNLRDTILDTFTDIEADAKDFRKSLEKTLVKDLLEKMVLDVPLTVTIDGEDKTFDGGFDEYGKDWNKRYIAAVKALQEARKTGNAEAIAEAQASVDALFDEVEGVYTQLEEGANEFRQRLKEIANDTTFTDMADSLVSSLMDVEGDVEDIANDMKKTIVKKLAEAFMVSDQIKPLLDELQATFNAVMGMEDLTPEQRTQMMKAGFTGTDAEGNEKVFLGIDDEGVTQRLTAAQTAIKALMEAIGYEFDKKEGFSDLRGAFISALTDMEGDASTFGKNIGKTMAEQMLDAYIDKTYSEEIDKINEEWAAALATGDPVKIEAIRQKVLTLYAAIGNDEQVKQLTADVKELQRELDTTFSGMGDDWASALMDMDSTAEDWGRQIGRSLTQKLVKELVVTKQLQKYLDDIQAAYNDAIGQEGATINSVLAAVIPKIDAAVAATEQWKPVVEEIAKRFQELDNTPLDNIRSTFLSQLMDMESDTKDFAKSISEILTEAFIDKFVLGEEFDNRLEEWKQEYASIMRGNYSEEDRATLLKQLKQAITTAKEGYAAEAAAIHELMGTANYADQSATMNMADKITYEQADQLLGINMAQELTLEQILATLQGGTISGVRGSDIFQQMYDTSHNDETAKQILAVLRSMSSVASVGSSDGYGEQIFNRLGTTNDYLRVIRDEVKAYLGNIAMYTANLVKL